MNYEYMKEYECNGVKPDLPGDVLVRQYYEGDWMSMVRAVEKWPSWNGVSKFRIEDERYKPAPEQGWYDYGRRYNSLPPKPKEICYARNSDFNNGEWTEVEVLTLHSNAISAACRNLSDNRLFWAGQFRPLDWDRELKREQGEKSREELIEALEKHHQEGSAIAAALLMIIECCKEQKK